MSRRRVLSFTGARADYGRLSSVWKAIERTPGLELILVASGMHLSAAFGRTVEEIEGDGFVVHHRMDILGDGGGTGEMPKAIGRGLLQMTDLVAQDRPDMILVQGDRSEMLIPAIVGSHLNIPMAHLAGGYVTEGAVDEVVRHSLTKMSHLHFTTSEECTKRVLGLGEEPWRIHQVGSPAIDWISRMRYPSRGDLFKGFGWDPARPMILATYHPVTTEADDMRRQAREFIEALKCANEQTLLTYPNTDLGNRGILEELEEAAEVPTFAMVKNLSTVRYLHVLRHADLMVGNSSSGFVEAPYFHLPVINVGHRQQGRERTANIIDVECRVAEIIGAIRRCLGDRALRDVLREHFKPVYGDGTSGEKIARILASVSLDRKLIQKKMSF